MFHPFKNNKLHLLVGALPKAAHGHFVSLSDMIRTRPTGRLFTSGFISFFGGRQPTGIIQFRLNQKSAPVGSKISERIQ